MKSPNIRIGFLLFALLGCSTKGAIVDGTCRDGLNVCGVECLDLSSNADNCGACGHQCGSLSCIQGQCLNPDASVHADADADSDSSSDGSDSDSSSDGSDSDSSSDSADTSESSVAFDGNEASDAQQDVDGGEQVDSCTPPYDNDQNCGACAASCTPVTQKCAAQGDAGLVACVPFCDLPLMQCGNQCFDFQNDETHCGNCTTQCISGLCQAGECRGAKVGQVVLIGMNYRSWLPGSPPARIFGNAIFLPISNPVKILSYTEYGDKASGGAVAQVNQLLSWAAADRGRVFFANTELGSSHALISTLSITHHDMLLVHDQTNAPDTGLEEVGKAWASSLDSYLRAGGQVVVLMTNTGKNQMAALVSASDLWKISSLAPATGHELVNIGPADAVGTNVLSPFLARPDTSTMELGAALDGFATAVIRDKTLPDAGPGMPVVLHRVVVP